jgi:hypothetical protein
MARDAGVTEFLRKPVTVESVIARVAEVIERPRPFVRCGAYFGPDRRRKSELWEGEERRASAESEQMPPRKAAMGG